MSEEQDVKIPITKTDIAIVVKCKCGGTIAASLLYGGISIDEEFMDTLAVTYNNGGAVEITNVQKTKVTLGGCECPENPNQ